MEFHVMKYGNDILLKPKKPFENTHINEVAGYLNYQGSAKSNEEIEQALKQAARKIWRDRD